MTSLIFSMLSSLLLCCQILWSSITACSPVGWDSRLDDITYKHSEYHPSNHVLHNFSQKHTVSGFVRDSESGENLIGATVYAPDYEIGTTTNRYGFFSLTLEADSLSLVISHVGYTPQFVHTGLEEDIRLNILLEPTVVGLEEVEVVAPSGTGLESLQMSEISLSVAQIQDLPALAGEIDILKTLQLLPGVQSGIEGTSGLYVRGGSPDQNLILLDGVPVYNPNHLFGFLSVFNDDAIKDVSLIKGGFPARYGGRLSSILELTMKEGDLNRYKGTASVGLVASSFTVEGPIIKNKSSFLIAARRTYIDILAFPFQAFSGSDNRSGYYFYDVSVKANYFVSDRDRIYLSVYTSRDRLYERDVYGGDIANISVRDDIGWRNLTITSRWNRVLGSKLFVNTLLGFTLYRSRNQAEEGNESGVQHVSFLSGITDGLGRVDFEYIPAPSHYVRFGLGSTLHSYHTGAFSERWHGAEVVPFDTLYTPDYLTNGAEFHAYAEDEIRLSSWLWINTGIHASSFFVQERSYHSIQPRVGIRLGLDSKSAVKMSFASMKQYVHVLTTSSGVSLPLDLWVPATDRVRPQEAIQLALGFYRVFPERNYDISIEGFYKKISHVIEYKDGTHHYNYSPTDNWENRIESGNGTSFGAELFVQKKRGRITGWVGYSLTKTTRKFAQLNNGKEFPYRYDRLHDVSLTANWQWKESTNIALAWVYGTGQAAWLPLGQSYGVTHLPIPEYFSNSDHLPITPLRIYGDRNSFRMPAHHRLDLAIHFARELKWAERRLSFGAYNAYNRKNTFGIEAAEALPEHREEQYLVFKKITAFPIIPFVNYRLEL